jgi:hypothetical protein
MNSSPGLVFSFGALMGKRQAGHLQFPTSGHLLRGSIWGNVPREGIDGVGQNFGVYIKEWATLAGGLRVLFVQGVCAVFNRKSLLALINLSLCLAP